MDRRLRFPFSTMAIYGSWMPAGLHAAPRPAPPATAGLQSSSWTRAQCRLRFSGNTCRDSFRFGEEPSISFLTAMWNSRCRNLFQFRNSDRGSWKLRRPTRPKSFGKWICRTAVRIGPTAYPACTRMSRGHRESYNLIRGREENRCYTSLHLSEEFLYGQSNAL